MYSFEQIKKIEELMEKGMTIEQIVDQTQISKSTLYKWKKVNQLKLYIKELIKQDRLDEAYEEIKKLTTEYGKQYLTPYLMAKIANKKGDRKEEKENLRKRLKALPNDIKAISSLIRIAREEGDIEDEKRLLIRLIELEPDNVKSISNLIKILREEGNKEGEKRLLETQLEIEPNNIIAMCSLVRIARKDGNREEEKRLLQQILKVDPDNIIAMRSLANIEKKRRGKRRKKSPTQKETTKKLRIDSKEEKVNLIEQARKIIHNSENILEDIELIATILEQESDETIKVLIQAEFAIKAGLDQRAELLLKRHKRASKGDIAVVKVMNKALEIALSKKAKIYDKVKWENLHISYAMMKENQEVSTETVETEAR